MKSSSRFDLGHSLALFGAWTLVLLTLGGFAGPQESPEPIRPHENRQPDGSYVLQTDNPYSIQAYLRDVGVGMLYLPTYDEWENMRETCLALGAHWRPLGHVLIPGAKQGDSYPLELCYYAAPNPDYVAAFKCANLGMAIRENRLARREIVCEKEWIASDQ